MALDDGTGAIREIDQALEEDQQLKELKKNLPFIIAMAVLVLVIVAGKQFWSARQATLATQNAASYTAASTLAEQDKAAGLSAFVRLTEEGPNGYAAMAAFRAAALAAETGDQAKAISLFTKVADNSKNEKRLRDLARVRGGYLALSEKRDRTMKILNGLETQNIPLGLYAREIAGLAAMEEKDYGVARIYFEEIKTSASVPPGLAQRAQELSALASLGSKGVDLSLKDGANAQDLLGLLDQAKEAEAAAAENVPENTSETEQGDNENASN